MANIFQINDDIDTYEFKEYEGIQGKLMHLATLEFEQKTYLALGTIQRTSLGQEGGILIVRQELDTDKKKKFSVVNEKEELEDVVPRFIEAIIPGIAIEFSRVEIVNNRETENKPEDRFMFDITGTDILQ